MKKEVISDRQGICLIIMFVVGEAIAMSTASAARKDSWLALLLK